MRVLLANKYFYRKGGAETFLFDLIREHEVRGYETIPFSMHHPDNEPSAYSEFFVRQVDYDHPTFSLDNLRNAWSMIYSYEARDRIDRLIRKSRPHIANLQNIYHQISPSILPVISSHGIPIILTLHDLKLACPNFRMRTNGEVCERCLPSNYHQAVLNRCVKDSYLASILSAFEVAVHRFSGIYEKNVSKFLVPSNFYKTKIAASGIPSERILHIPTFCYVDEYESTENVSDYFLYLGRLTEEKGLVMLVEAMKGMDKGRLVIVGDGPLKPRLQKIIDEQGLDHVSLLGYRRGEELKRLVREARFTVVPSVWYENCPRSIVESYASGTPVLGANIGGIPEMIVPGETGLLFEPSSPEELRQRVDLLMEDDEMITEMGRKGRSLARQRYSPAAHFEQLQRVYDEVLAHPPVA